jgi:hypothetical protein
VDVGLADDQHELGFVCIVCLTLSVCLLDSQMSFCASYLLFFYEDLSVLQLNLTCFPVFLCMACVFFFHMYGCNIFNSQEYFE